MKICLFALTGFGNSVLQSLLKSSIAEILLVTRKENGPFPYYTCEQITDVCRNNGVEFSYAFSKSSLEKLRSRIIRFEPELILTATFHLKIPKDVLGIASKGAVNIHPSLLPKYRGPTPTNWAIINEEKVTGISFHMMSDQLDKGEVLLQKEMPIGSLTDGQLRESLAKLAGDNIVRFVNDFASSKLTPLVIRESDARYYPKITSEEGKKILRSGNFSRETLMRGLTPFPGISIIEQG